MGKKSTSKKSAIVPGHPGVEHEKTSSSTPKNPGNEIDSIFASKKRKKPEQKNAEKLTEDAVAKGNKIRKKKNSSSKSPNDSNGNVDPTAWPRKKTGDGLTIYTEAELGIGKADAGGTPLCPFDCDCCF